MTCGVAIIVCCSTQRTVSPVEHACHAGNAALKLRIWGNHSATQFPDFYNAKISGKPAVDVIKDDAWLKETFISTIQQRGAAVLRARGGSSAASAANAAVDSAIVDRTDIPWRSDQCRSLGLKKA